MFYETFGALYPQFRTWPFVAFNGPIAVSVFFVLSGEALSSSYFAGRGTSAVAALAIKRHSRLSIPVLGSLLIVYVLQKFDLIWSHQAGIFAHSEVWLGAFAVAPLHISNILWFSLVGVYQSTNPDPTMNPFAWTMSAEMIGSFLVFNLIMIWDWLRYPRVTLIALAGLLLLARPSCYLANFVFGILFAHARHDGLFDRCRGPKTTVATTLFLPFVIAAEAWGFQTVPRSVNIIAPVLLAVLFFNRPFMAFFSSWPSRALGKISFSLYLIQFPILVSLTSFLIVHTGTAHNLTLRMASLIGLSSVAASLVAAVAFEPVELLTKRLGRVLVGALIAHPSSPTRIVTRHYHERRDHQRHGQLRVEECISQRLP